MNVSIETVMDLFESAVADGDAQKTLAISMQLTEQVRSDPLAVKWLTTPANIKHVHEILVDGLGVPPKTMMIKDRVPNTQKRAHLFAKGIENGIRRVV